MSIQSEQILKQIPWRSIHCFKFTGKFQQIDGRVAVQTVNRRFFSSAVFVFPVDGLENSGSFKSCILPEFRRPSTGIFQSIYRKIPVKQKFKKLPRVGMELGFSAYICNTLTTRPNYFHKHGGEKSDLIFPVDGLQNSGRI